MYPNWLIRIYHDNSIDDKIKCEIECLKDSDEKMVDNVDFCNIESVPKHNDLYLNFSYIHAMKWRWLPIGDYFVDVFSSRDSDSNIFQREIDSVNVWLNSKKNGHIMRDNPHHGTFILG